MNDALRVRRRQRVGHVPQNPSGLLEGELAFTCELVAQGFALDEGHHVVEEIVSGACSE